MTHDAKAIEQWQARLTMEHKQRITARQAEIDSVESIVLRSDTITQKGGIEMTSNKDKLPELTSLALIDRILISVDNLVYAKTKGITLPPAVELGNLKQITECGIALRGVLLKEDTLKRMGYYLQPAKGESK